jgi:hypothetical protein
LEVHIGGGGGRRMEPIGIAVLLAAEDIKIAVQLSVKYVTKVNGIPSSSNGWRYHRLAFTTGGYLACLLRAHTWTFHQFELTSRYQGSISYYIRYFYLALSFPSFTIHRLYTVSLCECMLLYTNHMSLKLLNCCTNWQLQKSSKFFSPTNAPFIKHIKC